MISWIGRGRPRDGWGRQGRAGGFRDSQVFEAENMERFIEDRSNDSAPCRSHPGSKLSIFFSLPVCRRSSLQYIRMRGVGRDGEKAWPSISNPILSGSRVGERKRRKEQRNTRNERRGQEGRKGGRGKRLSEGQDSNANSWLPR
jgi:hypothetical protein